MSYQDWSLKEICEFASEVTYCLASVAAVVVGMKFGEEAQVALSFDWLRTHQLKYFIRDLKTLGIDPHKLPLAIVCARSHYLGNAAGGLKMEYVEESPKRAWVRYDTGEDPLLPGISPKAQRAWFDGWHGNNGVLLHSIGVKNALRVGVVVTKVPTAGDPIMECYFEEYDHELDPSERAKWMPHPNPPESTHYGDAYLDMIEEGTGIRDYPKERTYRQIRNYAHYSSEDMQLAMLNQYGTAPTCEILDHCWRLIAVMYARQWKQKLDIDEGGAKGMALFIKALGDIQEEKTEVEEISNKEYVVRKHDSRHFKKMLDRIEPQLFVAQNSFYEAAAQCMRVPSVGPRIRVKFLKSLVDGDPYFEWLVKEV